MATLQSLLDACSLWSTCQLFLLPTVARAQTGRRNEPSSRVSVVLKMHHHKVRSGPSLTPYCASIARASQAVREQHHRQSGVVPGRF